MASGDVPQTESALLAQLPPSNLPGALPRDLLPPGERVYYETRPGLFSLYWGRLIGNGLWLALMVAFGASSVGAIGAAAFLASPSVIWVVVLYLQWRHRVYALTDQRVIRISGVRGSDFQDASYSQVHNLTIDSGEIRFDTTPPPPGGARPMLARHKIIAWEGVDDAPRVYTFVQQAFAFGLRKMRVAAVTRQRLDQIEGTSVNCPYCGSLIDLAALNPENPRCPSCSAPFELPS